MGRVGKAFRLWPEYQAFYLESLGWPSVTCILDLGCTFPRQKAEVQVTPKDSSSSVLFANRDWTPKNCPNKPKPDGSQFFLSFLLSFPINDFFFQMSIKRLLILF